MAGSVKDMKLPSIDEIFSTEETRQTEKATKERVMIVGLAEIDPFPDHPFRVTEDGEMEEMAKSIREYGVLTPAIVRKKEDGRYEMVSGHRRMKACALAGMEKLPVIVRKMTRDEAILYMVDSNLQRERILPSEKALAYKMKLEALKRQGQRTDLTSPPMVEKLTGKKALTTSILGQETGDSHEQVRRYIRLTSLVPELLQMVDENKVGFRPAVELSYLSKEQQEDLLTTIESEACTPSLAQAVKMKKFSQEGRLNGDVILSILSEEKANQREVFRFSREQLHLPKDCTPKEGERRVLRALEISSIYERYFPKDMPLERAEEAIKRAAAMYRQRHIELER